MGAILPLRYPSYCVQRFARLAVSTFILGVSLRAGPVASLDSLTGDVTIVASDLSAPLGEPVLALAWLDDTRLAVLSRRSVSVHRRERSGLVRMARRDLPPPLAVVRHPGGLILPGDDAFWVLTSAMPRAVLYALEGDRLLERAQAEALPWPEVRGGLRYRDGTNLLESPAGLLLTPSVEGLAVDPSGRLLILSAEGASPTGLTAGPTLAGLGRGVVATSSAAPPGAPDSVLILERAEGDLHVRGRLPVPGSLRALAGRRLGREGRLAAALETDTGQTVVLLIGLRRSAW
jgi:hypothetical protein